jgi:alginate export protein
MKSMTSGWLRHSLAFAAALVAVGFAAPVWAAFEIPEGNVITNVPHIPRAIPQKEAYEAYDPKIGKNFDVKNFWMRADLRVRPEWRKNTCFGTGIATTGNCNVASATANINPLGSGGTPANDFYVQQWVRLGIGYDLSPDVNFYMEIIDSAVWGGNGQAVNAGNGGDPLNHDCQSGGGATAGNCRLGVRAAYVLVRNLAGVQGLSMKAGRQYVIFGNHSIFGHFDWANTGYSHDGIMFQYSNKNFESYLGWFRNSETDLVQSSPVGSGAPNPVGSGTGRTASGDVDMFIFYNQIKSIPGFLIEPYYVYYLNSLGSGDNAGQGLGTAKHSNQRRHMVGNRVEMRKGNLDFINETAYQFGSMGDASLLNTGNGGNTEQRNIRISAWAMRTWLGYTHYQSEYKPRIAVNLDYASGDSKANCTLLAAYGPCTGQSGTFENFFPTNHIHMGYMDVMAWRNMMTPAINFQMRPSKNDHFEIWLSSFNLANSQDNWYRGAQGAYVFSKAGNTKKHIGDEIDLTWTRMFADGKVSLQATYGLLKVGGYVKENMGAQAQNQHWGFLQLWMNF